MPPRRLAQPTWNSKENSSMPSQSHGKHDEQYASSPPACRSCPDSVPSGMQAMSSYSPHLNT